jgi:bifunctional non-homologous end joining protein LigD
MFPQVNVTKGDLLRYYQSIAKLILPHLQNRPMTLERMPAGLAGKNPPHFWQKNTPEYYPKWIARAKMPSEEDRDVEYVLVNDEPSLLWLVNQGTITFHPWFSTIDDPDRPTFVLFDVDPHQSTFANAVKVAKELHKVLEAEKIKSFVKTTGKTGLHVMTPWKNKGNFAEARSWAEIIARRVVESIPKIATTERHIANRGERVYLDVQQNSKGKHGVPPYVVRATPEATISMPLDWKDLSARLDPKKFTVQHVARISKASKLIELL